MRDANGAGSDALPLPGRPVRAGTVAFVQVATLARSAVLSLSEPFVIAIR